MKIKVIVSILLIFTICFTFVSVNATSILDEIISQGNGFTGNDSGLGSGVSDFLVNSIIPMIGVIGNLVFAGVTVILGLKYVFASADGKAEVMETLPAFVLAVVFFFLGESLVNWFKGSLSFANSAQNWATVQGKIWWIISTVVQYLTFAGILFIGLRYMFASAEGKASIKANFGTLAIGLVFVFSASNVLKYIVSMGKEIL